MKVRCINNGVLGDDLTLNKEYNVLNQNEECYLITNDSGYHLWIEKEDCEIVEETRIKPEHYNLPITPLEYITKNNLGFIEGNIIKYISRYKNKNGLEDLKKAQEYLNELIMLNTI